VDSMIYVNGNEVCLNECGSCGSCTCAGITDENGNGGNCLADSNHWCYTKAGACSNLDGMEMRIEGAPSYVSWCNGDYTATNHSISGNPMFIKNSTGQSLAYFYWSNGNWYCDNNQDLSSYWGRIPSSSMNAVETAGRWYDSETTNAWTTVSGTKVSYLQGYELSYEACQGNAQGQCNNCFRGPDFEWVRLEGAPLSQSWCNGEYSILKDSGNKVYYKHESGQHAMYLSWSSGYWYCKDDPNTSGYSGRIPSSKMTAVETTGQWWGAEGYVSVNGSKISVSNAQPNCPQGDGNKAVCYSTSEAQSACSIYQTDLFQDCIDQNSQCAAWAARTPSVCTTHVDYMLQNCKYSCNGQRKNIETGRYVVSVQH